MDAYMSANTQTLYVLADINTNEPYMDFIKFKLRQKYSAILSQQHATSFAEYNNSKTLIYKIIRLFKKMKQNSCETPINDNSCEHDSATN